MSIFHDWNETCQAVRGQFYLSNRELKGNDKRKKNEKIRQPEFDFGIFDRIDARNAPYVRADKTGGKRFAFRAAARL
jgi:hypothetical protein